MDLAKPKSGVPIYNKLTIMEQKAFVFLGPETQQLINAEDVLVRRMVSQFFSKYKVYNHPR